MKAIENPFLLLGCPLSESVVKQFLAELGIDQNIRLRKGEPSEIVENYDLGIELTFDDERVLEDPKRDYLEGDLVLVNIRMYTKEFGGFKPYTGALPLELTSSMKRSDIENRLGKPSFSNENLGTARWDMEIGSLAVATTQNGEMKYVSVLIWP